MPRTYVTATLLAILFPCTALTANPTDGVHLSQETDGISVLINGELFTRYLISSGTRPVLWPVVGPTGKQMTRAYPVSTKRSGEATDHIHHRSVWIGYEGLGGQDFWHEPSTRHTTPLEIGRTIHRGFQVVKSRGDTGTIVSENDWVNSENKLVCTDRRTHVLDSIETADGLIISWI